MTFPHSVLQCHSQSVFMSPQTSKAKGSMKDLGNSPHVSGNPGSPFVPVEQTISSTDFYPPHPSLPFSWHHLLFKSDPATLVDRYLAHLHAQKRHRETRKELKLNPCSALAASGPTREEPPAHQRRLCTDPGEYERQ